MREREREQDECEGEGAVPLVAPPVNLRVRVVASIAVAGVEVAEAAWEEVEEEKLSQAEALNWICIGYQLSVRHNAS